MPSAPLPSLAAANAAQRHALGSHAVVDPAQMQLPRTFSPTEAAEILRDLGLVEMTECALRTRAYRRQIPFHLNGRRIRFTAADLREIAEGQARRPRPPEPRSLRSSARHAPAARRSTSHAAERVPVAWRARNGLDKAADRR